METACWLNESSRSAGDESLGQWRIQEFLFVRIGSPRFQRREDVTGKTKHLR